MNILSKVRISSFDGGKGRMVSAEVSAGEVPFRLTWEVYRALLAENKARGGAVKRLATRKGVVNNAALAAHCKCNVGDSVTIIDYETDRLLSFDATVCDGVVTKVENVRMDLSNLEIVAERDETWFTAHHPAEVFRCNFERAINWDFVLGLGQRPSDVCADIARENQQNGPYSWDLACRIGSIARLASNYGGESAVQFNAWFDMMFGALLKKEQLEGVRTPESPKAKGFWESLFG